jgi:hypothetical protein
MSDEMIRGLFEVLFGCFRHPRCANGTYVDKILEGQWQAFKAGFEQAHGAAILGLLDLPEPPRSGDPEP